jgi:nucleotide-binding universal stress UspA family protein
MTAISLPAVSGANWFEHLQGGRTGPLLVACDGTPGADGALRAARLLSAVIPRDVEVFSVLEPMPVAAPEAGTVPWNATLETSRRATLRRTIRGRVAELGDEQWPIELGTGDPAALIAERAFERRASLIVLGLGHHAVVDRFLGSELALRVMRLARVPVLAVPAGFDALPTRVVVAVDFSPQSLRATRLAGELLPRLDAVYLTHVTPRTVAEQALAGFNPRYREEIETALTRMQGKLPADLPTEPVTLTGDAARSLLGFAQVTGAGLIAMGTQGLGFVHRLLAGSVATRVVRGANCAVLVVPRRAVEGIREPAGSGWTLEAGTDPLGWNARLTAFTRANAGRRARLEVDDPELGAQAVVEDYIVRGVAYDPHDQRVEFMLAAGDGTQAHLSHTIGGVTSVDVLRDARGRDRTLRVQRGDSQTLLSLLG